MKERRACIIGNWKMHGSAQMIRTFFAEFFAALASHPAALSGIEWVICPPFVYLPHILENLHQLNNLTHTVSGSLGAQNTYSEATGAFTGEVAPEMLRDIGCQWVIVGHSERRTLFYEDNTRIARKFLAAYDAGLFPVLCVGETRAERETGKTWEVIQRQLEAVFAIAPIESLTTAVIAYEPVWAIGTGLTATPEQAEAVHLAIRDWIAKRDPCLAATARLLYGGSVKADNAAGLFAMPNIDGALVGGASIIAQEFFDIVKSAKARI